MKRTKPYMIVALVLGLSTQLYAGAQDDLFTACMQCDIAGLNKALAAGADVNVLHSSGQNAVAMAYFCPEATKLLLEKGCDPNGGNYPAILSAANNYAVETMKLLLAAGANPDLPAVVDPGQSLRNMIEQEKAKGKKANKDMIAAWEAALKNLQPSKVYALQIAVQQTNCVPCLKLLLENGARLDVITDGNILHTLAAFSMSREERKNGFAQGKATMESYGLKVPDWYGNLPDDINGTSRDMLNVLMTKKPDINKANSYGLTPLIVALKGLYTTPQGKANKIDVAKAMIENGADPTLTAKISFDGQEAKWIPVCVAAEGADVELMNMILDKGADINASTSTSCLSVFNGTWGGDGYTPLIIAIMSKNMEVAKMLVEKGADLKTGTNGYSIMETKLEDVKCVVTSKNKTPIYWAVEKDDLELIQAIADKMVWKFNPDFSYKLVADVNRVNMGLYTIGCREGKTKIRPSMYAGDFGFKEAKKYLLAKGL